MKHALPSSRPCDVESLEPRTFFSATGPSLAVANLDVLPGPERLVFNRIQRAHPHAEVGPGGKLFQPPDNAVHDVATLRLTDNGNAPLRISSLAVDGPWKIINAPAHTISPGGHADVTLKFIADHEPPHDTNQTNGPFNPDFGGVWSGSLTVATNDPKNARYVEQLSGWWQDQSEASEEPNLQTIVNKVFNYQTNIAPPAAVTLDEPNDQRELFGEEVLSPYWKAANPRQPVFVRDLASWHMQGSPVVLAWYKKGQRNGPTVFTTSGLDGQSFLPHAQGNKHAPAQGTFNPGSQSFGFKIDYERSDDSLNNSGGGGHHIRFYPVRDHTGAVIPNTYFMCLDYSPGSDAVGENFDFQDQVYVVTNVKPGG